MNDSYVDSRKHYSAPQLKFYGDLRSLTLGTTGSDNETMAAGPRKVKTKGAAAPDIYRQ